MSNRLSWLYVDILWNPTDRVVTVLDLVDTNNEPAMMTRSKRGVKDLWSRLSTEFSISWTWASVQKIVDESGIKTHHWCRMD